MRCRHARVEDKHSKEKQRKKLHCENKLDNGTGRREVEDKKHGPISASRLITVLVLELRCSAWYVIYRQKVLDTLYTDGYICEYQLFFPVLQWAVVVFRMWISPT